MNREKNVGKMVFWTDFEILVKTIAWIEVVISVLFLFVIGIFTILLVSVPEALKKLVEDYPEEHHEIGEFLKFDDGIQFVIVMLLFSFWTIILVLAILLLRWVQKMELKGLWTWFVVTIVISVVSFPFDVMWLWENEFAFGSVVILILGYAYGGFSLWAVWNLIGIATKRATGESRQIVEFQAL